MAQQPRSVTIKLTTKQRSQIKTLTGQEHGEVRFEAQTMDSKSAPKRTFPGRDLARAMPGIAAGKRLGVRTAGKKLGIRTAGKKLGVRTAGKKLGIRTAGKRFGGR